MKVCTKCKVEKELSEFGKDSVTKDGFLCYCRNCHKLRIRYYRTGKYSLMVRKTDEEKKEYAKEYYQKNKEKIKEYVKESKKEYYQKNKEKINKKAKDKKDNYPLHKMKCTLRTRIYYAFKRKGWKKNTKIANTLGASFEICKQHIEKQFTDGMTWNNHGLWHYDHIIPAASARTSEEMIKLFHYTNLQPLWAEDNLKKGDKMLY